MTALHPHGAGPAYGHGPVQPPGGPGDAPEPSGADAAATAGRAPLPGDTPGSDTGEPHIVRGLD
ncbi:hypothetical protein [Streptomyces sp. NPDC008150]|uniref:hypothetical protein n=1 Tax=Streptomyces sp. NPDC008150 TaxID=3364816 RepID=UPI0036E9F159